MAKHTKVMRYQIINPVNDSWDVFGKVLREIQRETRTTCLSSCFRLRSGGS